MSGHKAKYLGESARARQRPLLRRSPFVVELVAEKHRSLRDAAGERAC